MVGVHVRYLILTHFRGFSEYDIARTAWVRRALSLGRTVKLVYFTKVVQEAPGCVGRGPSILHYMHFIVCRKLNYGESAFVIIFHSD